jgi:hypothetical protein
MPKDRSFQKYGIDGKDKVIVELLEEMNEHLARIVELLEGQGRIRPG